MDARPHVNRRPRQSVLRLRNAVQDANLSGVHSKEKRTMQLSLDSEFVRSRDRVVMFKPRIETFRPGK